MITTDESSELGLQPAPPRPGRRAVGADRVLTGYAATALSVLCGIPAVVIGFVGGNQCHAEGFACLGWLIYGLLAAGVIAVAALLVLAVRFRLGVGFWLVALVIAVAALTLQHDARYVIIAILGAPGLAAWLTDPPRGRHGWARHWLPRATALIMVVAVLPLTVAALGR